jgi:chemotaxis protein methyltransferase CheR
MSAIAASNILDLTREDYEAVRQLVYAKSGINLGDKKTQLVRARLGKMVRQGGFGSFREYFRKVEQDASGQELGKLLDAISTNTTHLFREMRHFELLRQLLNQWLDNKAWRARHNTVRIWSAACSSGEEPHSIAMVAHDVISRHPGVELKILATDLSGRVLRRAQEGVYEPHRLGTVPAELRSRYFVRDEQDGEPVLKIGPAIREAITFARFNLMTPTFPFRHKFNVIFCRNVMIYFDKATQQTLVGKMHDCLEEGGYLLIGHSESLNPIEHKLSYVAPTIYRKN